MSSLGIDIEWPQVIIKVWLHGVSDVIRVERRRGGGEWGKYAVRSPATAASQVLEVYVIGNERMHSNEDWREWNS